MRKRNSFGIGRPVSALIAVILIVFVPIRSYAGREITDRGLMTGYYLDAFTSLCQTKGRIEIGDYSDLIGKLSGIGIVCETVLSIERENAVFMIYDDEYDVNDEAMSDEISEFYSFISNDDIFRELADAGVYDLAPGDMLNVSIRIDDNCMLKRISRKMFIPDPIQEKYTSGILIH